MTTTSTAVRHSAFQYRSDVVIVADDGHGHPSPYGGQVVAQYRLPDSGSPNEILRVHGWKLIGAWTPFRGAVPATTERPQSWVAVRRG